MKRLLLLTLAATVMALPAAAQLESGTKIRLKTKGNPTIYGTVASIQDGRLELSGASWRIANAGPPTSFSIDEIRDFEVSGGRDSRGKRALVGAAIGAASLALAFGLYEANRDTDCPSWEYCWGRTTGLAAIGGAIIGAPLGAALGALTAGERWEDVPLDKVRVWLAPVPGRGVGVALNLRF
jgi:hypothetical protein